MTRYRSHARLLRIFAACLLLAGAATAGAEKPPELPSEFRAAWIATVANIDWPSKPGLPAEEQQQELIGLLDKAVGLNLNAIVLQVRPACDALYASELEPWSPYLTGVMGQAPAPGYDPLEFAVREAHRRGLLLHAWFNPYRASHPSYKGALSDDHISRRLPESVVEYGVYQWLDPSDEDASRHSLAVIMDVVRRYDIDGVHFDDYFYPYPITAKGDDGQEADVPFPDDRSWDKYVAATTDGDRLSRDDWRRQSINQFVERVYREIKQEKPHVMFGVSPFGIWRPGYPESVVGFDAHEKLYADSKLWLEEGWVDYFTPQLYWPVRSAGQSYPILLEWWTRQNPHGRPIWPGLFTSKVRSKADGDGWRAAEIVQQVQLTQAFARSDGNVHFSMKALSKNYDGVADALASGPYAEPALPPVCGWLAGSTPPPTKPSVRRDGGQLIIESTTADNAWLYALQTKTHGRWTARLLPAAAVNDADAPAGEAYVTAVDRLGRHSEPAHLPAP